MSTQQSRSPNYQTLRVPHRDGRQYGKATPRCGRVSRRGGIQPFIYTVHLPFHSSTKYLVCNPTPYNDSPVLLREQKLVSIFLASFSFIFLESLSFRFHLRPAGDCLSFTPFASGHMCNLCHFPRVGYNITP